MTDQKINGQIAPDILIYKNISNKLIHIEINNIYYTIPPDETISILSTYSYLVRKNKNLELQKSKIVDNSVVIEKEVKISKEKKNKINKLLNIIE